MPEERCGGRVLGLLTIPTTALMYLCEVRNALTVSNAHVEGP